MSKSKSSVTASRFFDPVVLVIGEKTGFKANTAVDMNEVVEAAIERSDLTEEEREAHEDKFLRRRVSFAFRNRRAKYVEGSNIEALTVLVDGKGGQWGLTEAGVAKARDLSVEDFLPPEPEPEEPEPEPEEPEPEEPEEPEPEPEEPEPEPEEPEPEPEEPEEEFPPEPGEAVAEEPKPKKKKRRRRGPRTLSEINAN